MPYQNALLRPDVLPETVHGYYQSSKYTIKFTCIIVQLNVYTQTDSVPIAIFHFPRLVRIQVCDTQLHSVVAHLQHDGTSHCCA
jgi:hypothetical protein